MSVYINAYNIFQFYHHNYAIMNETKNQTWMMQKPYHKQTLVRKWNILYENVAYTTDLKKETQVCGWVFNDKKYKSDFGLINLIKE